MNDKEIKEEKINIDQLFANLAKSLDTISSKNIPKEKVQSEIKKQIEEFSKIISEKQAIIEQPSKSAVDVDISTSTFQLEISPLDIPSCGVFFKIPDKIKLKLELTGEDFEAIAKYSQRINPNEVFILRYTNNDLIGRLSALQDFIIKKFTNISPENITIQDKIHLNSIIGLNNLLKPSINFTCSNNHTQEYLISDLFKNNINLYPKFLDINQLISFCNELKINTIQDENGFSFTYEINNDKIEFKALNSSYMPIILAPKSPLDIISFATKKINDTEIKYFEAYEFYKKLPLKYIQSISLAVLQISIGTPLYGYDLGSEIKLECSNCKEIISSTVMEVLSNFFILA